MKTIPFYPNYADGNRCVVAIYQMLFDYFLNIQASTDTMEEYVGLADGTAAWTIKPLTTMAKQGFDIRMIEPFDYARYASQGVEYVRRVFSAEKAEWMIEHSNIADIDQYIPDFLRTVQHENRQASLADIDAMLREDRLVFITVNSHVLNDEPGYTEHAILVIQREGEQYVIHDPGLPPRKYRRISRALLWKAMGGKDNTSEVTGFIFKNGNSRRRLDMHVLAERPRLSRAFAVKLIENGKVLVNGNTKKAGYKVQADDIVTIDYDETELDQVPAIDLPVLYEDDYCIVIDKPAGVLTHAQGALIAEATVATYLRHIAPDMHGERAGIVHRLDRATSGVIVVAKNQATLAFLQKQFADRTVRKSYTAIVEGRLKQSAAVIDMPIERNPKAPATFRVGQNGKPATTQYQVVRENEHASIVELYPKTGRTHQLRVHMQQLGHPIIGDPLYGSGSYGDRLFLHAHELRITLPNGITKVFRAPLPAEFNERMAV